MKPQEIENESFRIILAEMGPHEFTPSELAIVQRVIHATADFDYGGLLQFSPDAIRIGIHALRGGCKLVCDVQMIKAGVNQARLAAFGGSVECKVNDPQVHTLAGRLGKTRAEVAMQQMGNILNGAVVAVGNAPTALFEVLRLFNDSQVRPALVIGAPVGFVNAAESKEALMQSPLNFITTRGRKGGSTVAVAIVNALLRLSEEINDA